MIRRAIVLLIFCGVTLCASAATCTVSGFSFSCDTYGGVTGTKIACNGGGATVIGQVGYFHQELIGNRWWLCTPSNNPFFEESVYVLDSGDLTGSAGTNFAATLVSKYGNSYPLWAANVIARILQQGFNVVGPYAGMGSHNMYPASTFSEAANPTSLPFIYQVDVANDCERATVYQTKNVYNGLLTPIGRDFPDVFDPAWTTCAAADITSTGSFFVGGNQSRMGPFTPALTDTNKYMEGIWVGDTDNVYGLTSGPATPDHGAAPQLGAEFAVASPTQATGPGGREGTLFTYSSTTFYGKSEWLSWIQGTAESHASISCTRTGGNVTCALGDSTYGPNDVLTVSSCTDSSFNSTAGTGVTISSITSSTLTFALSGAGSSGTCTLASGPGYATIAAFNTAWACGAGHYTTFGSAGGWPRSMTSGTGLSDEDGSSTCFPNGANGGLSGGNATAQNDLTNFLQRITNKYFQEARDSSKASFPNHMTTGPGFISTKTYPQVIASAMHYLDLPEFWMEPKWAVSYLPNAYNVSATKKGMVLWTNLSASGESDGLPNSYDAPPATPTDSAICNIAGGVTNYDYASQTVRGQCYNQLSNVYWNAQGSDGNYFVTGERWWELTDNSSQQVNFGLIDQFDNVYNTACPVTATVASGDNGYTCGKDAGNYNSGFIGTANSAGTGTNLIAGNLVWILGVQQIALTGVHAGILP